MIDDLHDIFVLEEHFRECFREGQEAIECVLLDDEVWIVDEVVEMGEPVDENALDVLFVRIETEAAEEQRAGLSLAWPAAADDPRDSVGDLVDQLLAAAADESAQGLHRSLPQIR